MPSRAQSKVQTPGRAAVTYSTGRFKMSMLLAGSLRGKRLRVGGRQQQV